MTSIPALFVSHGSPLFALEPGTLGPNLQRFGAALDGAAAIVVVSPHWQTRGLRVTGAASLDTIHDFGGFPQPLYALQYPAQGDPALAARVAALLDAAGLPAILDPDRGLDHGAWVPLRYLRGAADLPVLQVSLPIGSDVVDALRLGRALAPLRGEGVLVVGSGSLTHNLFEFRRHVDDPEYAHAFADWVADAVARGDTDALVGYRARAPHAARAHPTEEHYLPLLVAVGAAGPQWSGQRIEGGITDAVLSMDSYAFHTAEAA